MVDAKPVAERPDRRRGTGGDAGDESIAPKSEDAPIAQVQRMEEEKPRAVAANYVLPPELKGEAERVFALADKDGSSTLDMMELANLRNSPAMAEMMMATIDTDRSGKVGRVEWIEYVTAQAAKSEKATWRLLEVYTKQIAEDKFVATTVTADTEEEELLQVQVADEVTTESVEAALASVAVTDGAYEPVLTTFGGRVVEVRSEAAEVLTQEPAPPQDVQSPTAASLKAAREASEPVPPLLDLSPDVHVERSPLPSEMRAAQRTSLQILIDGEGRGSILIGAEVEGA